MRYVLSILIFYFVSTLSLSQQNSILNLSSSLHINQNKSSLFETPSNQFLVKRKNILSTVLEENPYEVFSVNGSKFNNQKNWTNNRKELRFSIGVTQFLGDLGGKDQIGTDYRLTDLDLKSTNLMGMIGYRYRLSSKFATTTSLTLGMLKGDDALTTEKFRMARNLRFRAPILELTQRIDFMIYTHEKIGKRYNIRGIKGFKNRNEQIYIFAGVGLVGFMPQGIYNGKWYNLRPLSTEGQGLLGGTKKTLPVTVTLPIGIGFRVGISREWRIGVETSYMKTFSDYIDDVHGVYYDKDLLAAQKGPIAAALSDRSDFTNPDQHNWFVGGQQRGDKQKDAYFFVNIVLTRNITYRNYTKVHKRYKLSKSKYKF
jgi:hypothetical protein